MPKHQKVESTLINVRVKRAKTKCHREREINWALFARREQRREVKQIVTIITHMVVVIKPTLAMIETIKPDGSHHCLQTRKQILKFVKWLHFSTFANILATN